MGNQIRQGAGTYDDRTTIATDFELFEKLPAPLREFIRNAPFKASARDVQEALDAGWSVEKIIETGQLFVQKKIAADAKLVWNRED